MVKKRDVKEDDKIVIELGEKASNQVRELRKELKVASEAIVVEDSLRLMRALSGEVRSGGEVVIENKSGRKRLIFL